MLELTASSTAVTARAAMPLLMPDLKVHLNRHLDVLEHMYNCKTMVQIPMLPL